MAHITEDRILETTAVTGTGDATLLGAVAGFRTFASKMTSPADTCHYLIEAVDAGGVPTGAWELGRGTYSAANTLTRTTVIRSSNADAAVTFAAGTKRVALVVAAPTTSQLKTDWRAALGAGSGSGDVVGPASAVDSQVAVFDSTTGKLLKDGGKTVADLRDVVQNSQSAAYTFVLSDANKHILHPAADTTARIFTVPANGSVPYPIGTAITVVNQNAAGVITIAITTDTMRLAGVGTTGSRTLAANGMATLLKITSTEWIINGVGLT